MTQFDLEDEMVSILLKSELCSSNEGEKHFLSGEVFKEGTRTEINNEDMIVEVLSIDDKQFQNALVSVRTYVNDLNIGSPNPVPDIKRLKEIATKFEKTFKSENSSYALTTAKYRLKLESAPKRERAAELGQHYVECLFKLVICNF